MNNLFFGLRLISALCIIATVSQSLAFAAEPTIRGVNLPLVRRGANWQVPLEQMIAENRSRVSLAKAAGFNALRILVPMQPFFPAPSPELKDKILRLMEDTVSNTLANGLTIVMTFETPWGISTGKIVCEDQNRDAYKASLIEIIQSVPDKSNIAMEAMNEPPSCPADRPGNPAWEPFQQDIYKTIRATHPHVRFVVTAPAWGGLDGLASYNPAPYRGDPNILYTFHYYLPFLFTHQQADYLRADHLNKYVQNLVWPHNQANAAQIRDQSMTSLRNDPGANSDQKNTGAMNLNKLFDEFPAQGSPVFMASEFDVAAKWAAANHIANDHILLGEFGVRRPNIGTSHKVDDPLPSAAVWLAAVRQAAESRHMPWIVWDLDSDFGVMCGDMPKTGSLCPNYAKALGLNP